MNTILFDLQGTLLQIDKTEYLETIRMLLRSRLESDGFDVLKMGTGIEVGFKAVQKNSGVITNDECFYKAYCLYMNDGEKKASYKIRRTMEKEFTKFVKSDIDMIRYMVDADPVIPQTLEMLHDKGYHLVLAADPYLTEDAVDKQLSWIGVDPKLFSHKVTVSNICYSKNDIGYYKQILRQLDSYAGDCMMVGNDAKEDMQANELGMDVFLIDTNLTNEHSIDTFEFKRGSFRVFNDYAKALPSLK